MSPATSECARPSDRAPTRTAGRCVSSGRSHRETIPLRRRASSAYPRPAHTYIHAISTFSYLGAIHIDHIVLFAARPSVMSSLEHHDTERPPRDYRQAQHHPAFAPFYYLSVPPPTTALGRRFRRLNWHASDTLGLLRSRKAYCTCIILVAVSQ